MSELKGIVNKPQFDCKFFCEGDAVKFTTKSNGNIRHALLGRVSPLVITIWYYDGEDDCTSRDISIHEVVKGEVELEILIPQSRLGTCGPNPNEKKVMFE